MTERIIQFGEGNFLRGFVDWFIHGMNTQGIFDGKVVVVQPIELGRGDILNEQNGVYNLYLRGIQDGEAKSTRTEVHSIARCVNPYANFDSYLKLAEDKNLRFIISNTTEAGIEFDPSCRFTDTPAKSFPGKLTQLLYRRFTLGLNGFIILSCELIDSNGDELKRCVLAYADAWGLGADFSSWIKENNTFSNTLVDRIVTGYPKDEAEALCAEIGYEDKLIDTGELFHLWVIEGNFEDELPLQKAGFNVIWTDDVKPYKKMKVRVLNGAHTSTVFPALLAGIETVGECLNDELFSAYLKHNIDTHILPVLGNSRECVEFANAVVERFRNPYIRHLWKSISLNSVSKFSVRVLPTITDYTEMFGEAARSLVFSLAALIYYYKTSDPSDSAHVIEYIKSHSIEDILANAELWGKDISCLTPLVNESTDKLTSLGVREAIKWAIS